MGVMKEKFYDEEKDCAVEEAANKEGANDSSSEAASADQDSQTPPVVEKLKLLIRQSKEAYWPLKTQDQEHLSQKRNAPYFYNF